MEGRRGAKRPVSRVSTSKCGQPSAVTETTPSADIFDSIATLKADAALAMHFDVADRVAATSPGPALLHTLADAMPRHDLQTIVDLGAGLGGASTWLATYTGATVIAVEPCDGAREAARTLFPELDIRAGTAQRSGLGDGIADVVVMVGVASLLTDLAPALNEALRLLRANGLLGIADMFLNPDTVDARVERSGVNVLRSASATAAAVRAAGFEIVAEHAAIDAKPDGWWADRSNQLHERILERHRDDPSIAPWIADQEQLATWFASDHVHNGCLIARPRGVGG